MGKVTYSTDNLLLNIGYIYMYIHNIGFSARAHFILIVRRTTCKQIIVSPYKSHNSYVYCVYVIYRESINTKNIVECTAPSKKIFFFSLTYNFSYIQNRTEKSRPVQFLLKELSF